MRKSLKSKPCPSKGKKRKRPKKLRPGRLDAAGMKALREERYALDKGKCVDCGSARPLEGVLQVRMHLAHVRSRGASGSDTIENTRSKCYECHIIKEHGLKSSKLAPDATLDVEASRKKE